MSANQKLDEIKAKLQKLIAHEESARKLGNLAEAEAFASKIQTLLLQYELDIEEIRGRTQQATAPVGQERVDITDIVGSHEGIWVYNLYSCGARNNFCKVIMPSRWTLNYLLLIGEEANREFTHYFVHQLISKLRELSRSSFNTYKNGGGTDKRNTYIRSFLVGAVDGIRQRLNEDREKAKADQPQVYGLVLRKDAALIEYMRTNFRNLGVAKGTSNSSSAGYSNGVQAGRGVNVNKGVGSNRGMGGTKLLN